MRVKHQDIRSASKDAYGSADLFGNWRTDFAQPLSDDQIRTGSFQDFVVDDINVVAGSDQLKYLAVNLTTGHPARFNRESYYDRLFPFLRREHALMRSSHIVASDA